MSLQDLINETKTVNCDSFVDLIKNIKLLQKTPTIRTIGKLAYLRAKGHLIVVGDLHGDLESLMHILRKTDFLERAKNDNIRLVFLGDYGDRGLYSPEVYYSVLKLKKTYPEKVLLMRGNHEAPEDILAYPHQLPRQLENKFGNPDGTKIYEELVGLFDYLNTAVLVDGKAVLIHGGIPSQVTTTEELAYAHENHPHEPHLTEMLWNDPKEKLKGIQRSPRGIGNVFGEDVTEKFLNNLNVNLLIRGHESCEGFKVNHNNKVVTLFSTNKRPYTNKQCGFLLCDLDSFDQGIIKACIRTF